MALYHLSASVGTFCIVNRSVLQSLRSSLKLWSVACIMPVQRGRKGQTPDPQDFRHMILRMSKKGMRVSDIADVCDVQLAEVVTILAQEKDERGWRAVVKRLMTDPPELCCPLSLFLFEDPVVLNDGNTYEKLSIKTWLEQKNRSPLTGSELQPPAQLHPNQNMISRVISFKEEIVDEILDLGPLLLRGKNFEVLEVLLERARSFIRPHLDRKQYLLLLTLRMGMPDTDNNEIRGEAKKEAQKLLAQAAVEGQMEGLLHGIKKPEMRVLLTEIDDSLIETLHRKMRTSSQVCKTWIDQEFASRLAKVVEHCSEELLDHDWPPCPLKQLWPHCPLKQLWQLLIQNCSGPHVGDWPKAAGLVLATFAQKVPTPMTDIDTVVLGQAYRFLNNRQDAIDFGNRFFNYGFHMISMHDEAAWPPSSSARIVLETAARAKDKRRKFELLLEAYELNAFDALIQETLFKQLRCKILETDFPSASTDKTIDLEELFLKLLPGQIPDEMIHKLSLTEAHLKHFKGDLMLLAEQLKKADRCHDAARVAVMFAQGVLQNGDNKTAEEVFFFAFQCDHSNSHAAAGLLNFAERVLTANNVPKPFANKNSEVGIASQSTLLLDWNLTGKDFKKSKAEGKDSNKFRISKKTTAWISICTKGPYPKCILSLNRATDVKLKVQAGSSTRVVEICDGMKFELFDLDRHSDLEDRMTVHAL